MNITNIKQIFRQLLRRKVYTTINILGLGIGMGCTILMTTYLIHEYSYDSYHSKSKRIFRVVDGNTCGTFYAMGTGFKQSVPEIENVFSLLPIHKVQVKQNQTFITEENLLLSDASILQILDIPILSSNGNQQLKEPNTLIISEKIAGKYFPKTKAVGQYLSIAINSRVYNLKITGIFKDLPSNSSIKANFIGDISFAFPLLWDLSYTLGIKEKKTPIDYQHEWKRNDFRTFVLLRPNVNKALAESKCSKICLTRRGYNENGGIHLQPISDIYLNSVNLSDTEPFKVGQHKSVWIFSVIGILILLVAAINFVMISNADNETSISEIACRKINGASNNHILAHIMLKSFLISFISLIPAIAFVRFALSYFNANFHMDLNMQLFLQLPYISILLCFTIFTGICSGLFLGITTSTISPLKLLHKNIGALNQKTLNGILITVQFSIFILLISCLFFMKKQFNYSLTKDLGFKIENIIVLDLNEETVKKKITSIQDQISADPNVIECRPTSIIVPPSDGVLNISYNDKETGKPMEQESVVFGPGITELLNMQIKEGVSFNETNIKNRSNILINESAAKKYNVKAGEGISNFNVIGIVKDFHFHALYQPISPLFIFPQKSNFPFLVVKTNGNNKAVKEHILKILGTEAPNLYFEVETLNERLSRFYQKEENQIGMLTFFSLVVLVISIMGLFGFVSLNLTKRVKEIGIRKINGAKSIELLVKFNLQYIKLVLVAFIIVCPITLYSMHKWLEGFAYKTELSWWIFALAGLLALGIALLTVSWQSWRAATRNPVESLRYE